MPWEQCQMTTPIETKLGGSDAQYMNQKDQAYAQQVLEIVPTKELADWKSSETQYTMLPTKTYNKDESRLDTKILEIHLLAGLPATIHDDCFPKSVFEVLLKTF